MVFRFVHKFNPETKDHYTIFRRDQLDPSVSKKRTELYNELFNSLFNPTKIEYSLDKEPLGTLDALLWATKNGFISIRNEQGKEIWKGIFDYIKKHDFSNIENQMYKEYKLVGEPEIKNRIWYNVRLGLFDSIEDRGNIGAYFSTEGLGMLLTGLTVGIIPWYYVARLVTDFHIKKSFKKIDLWEIVKEDNLTQKIPQTS